MSAIPTSRRGLALTLSVAARLALGVGLAFVSLLPSVKPLRAEAVQVGGPFTLTNHRSETVTEATFAGRHMLIYFGYSFCPDLCPTSLHTMAAAYDLLPADERDQVWPIFITIDPERDTVEALADYVPLFHDDMVGLTGSVEQINAAADAYRVYHAKNVVDEGSDEYYVDHSSFYYVMGPDGRYVTHFGHNATEEEMAAGIRKVLQ
jgi:protein SCO1/2